MAYKANKSGQVEYGPENAGNDNYEQSQMSKKERNRENTKALAKDAGTLALQGLGVPGPLAGMAANKIASNPLVNKTLNNKSDLLHKSHAASHAINSAAENPLKNVAGASSGKGTTGKSPTDKADTSGVNNVRGKTTSNNGTNLLKKALGGGNSSSKAQGVANFAKVAAKIPFPVWIAIGIFALILFLLIIVTVISQYIPMFSSDDEFSDLGMGGVEYVANSEEEQAYLERLKKIEKEYKDKGAKYNSGYISATFSIMTRYDTQFSYDDMTESEIRTLSKMMFKDSQVTITCEMEGAEAQVISGTVGEEPTCPSGYVINSDKTVENFVFDEKTFKTEIANYMKKKLSLESDEEATEIADEIFEYINNYQDLVGKNDSGEVAFTGNLSYWWPIGSDETTNVNGNLFATGNPAAVTITSTFGARVNPVTGVYQKAHGAIDIAGGSISVKGAGQVAAIAAKDGIVEYVNKGCMSHIGSSSDLCGGGYGNHIIIKHSDGNYTLYAHLHQNSISVQVGNSVAQGQVIGMVGNSGNSTGAHLHFEVRVGQNTMAARGDPLNFVDPDNPRPAGNVLSEKAIAMLHYFEGTGPTPDANNYFVYDDGAGVLTVGYGVAIKYNLDRFEAFGIDSTTLKVGDAVPIAVADAIKSQEIAKYYSNVTALLSREGITLEQYQIEALVLRAFNIGNVVDFPKNYKLYGNTQELYDNYMSKPVKAGGKYMDGLRKRREAEWNLFHTGTYMN